LVPPNLWTQKPVKNLDCQSKGAKNIVKNMFYKVSPGLWTETIEMSVALSFQRPVHRLGFTGFPVHRLGGTKKKQLLFVRFLRFSTGFTKSWASSFTAFCNECLIEINVDSNGIWCFLSQSISH
jgi:hypothetical protein